MTSKRRPTRALLLITTLVLVAYLADAARVVGDVPIVGTRETVPRDTGVLEVEVRNARGETIDVASVGLYNQSSGSSVTSGSTSGGILTIANIRPGTYKVTAGYMGWSETKTNIVIHAGIEKKVAFDSYNPDNESGTLQVTVNDVSGNQMEDVSIRAWDYSWNYYIGEKTTDSSGEVAYTKLLPGNLNTGKPSA